MMRWIVVALFVAALANCFAVSAYLTRPATFDERFGTWSSKPSPAKQMPFYKHNATRLA